MEPTFPESRKKMPRFELELAPTHGIELEASKRERLEWQTVGGSIPALFVCVLLDGPLNSAAHG
jgi:hypothetical protein